MDMLKNAGIQIDKEVNDLISGKNNKQMKMDNDRFMEKIEQLICYQPDYKYSKYDRKHIHVPQKKTEQK